LIARARAGDEDSFGEFVRRHMDAVHRWMVRAVGEGDADDMTQDVFLRAYRGLPRFRDQAPPRAWLAAIADNAIKNRSRSRSRFRRIFAADRARESGRAVLGALQKLPLEFRLPVVLRDLEEWSYEEIASSLELPIGTVKSRIARGRGHLRAILAPLLTPERNP
jgi:RNA polymerase sigma-70 factor (ECF subfamily)